MSKSISDYQKDYQSAAARGDTAGMQAAHAGAESVRASQGYSGGADGSQHISISNNSSSSSKGSSSSSSGSGSIFNPNMTASEIRDAFDAYKKSVEEKNSKPGSSGDGYIYNGYGEIIGKTAPGQGYTDYSKEASNAVVNPNFEKTADNSYAQRQLTATNGSEPGFMDYSQLSQLADEWLKNNPGSLWDNQSLVDLWKSKYGDISTMAGAAGKYASEFGGSTPNLTMPGTVDSARAVASSITGNTKPQETSAVSNIIKNMVAKQNTGTSPYAANGYQNNTSWVGNAYPGAKWNADTRTITTSDGRVLREGTDFYIGSDNRAYITNTAGTSAVGLSSATPSTATTTTQNDPFEGVWGQFMDWAQNYVQKPSTTTPSYSDYSQTIEDQLRPALELQIADLLRSREKAEKNIDSDFARRGFYGNADNQKKIAEVLDSYGDAEAALRANYLNNVANMAMPLYQNIINQQSSKEQAYNQGMINLGLAVMNGMIDQTKFVSDDAYRQAVLARMFSQDALSAFGTAGTSSNL